MLCVGLAPGTRLGRYEIVSLLGAGGMGEVYRARDTTLRREVAVKVLLERVGDDSERRRRFEKEARAAAELEHPNVVAVHDFGVHEGAPYLVTELLDGKTLAETLQAGRPPRARAIEIGVAIARGVAAAHDRGTVHRDLKPANVFVCRDGRVKILDFGLAAHVADGAPRGEDSTATESGVVVGTPAYMSPEQVRGQRADPRADLFALGLILYEMLAGRRAFAGDSAVEIGHAILTDDPEPLEDPTLDAIVRHCLAKDPAARARSAADLAFALETFAQARPAAAAGSRRAPALAIVGALAVALALGAVVSPRRAAAPAPRYSRVTFENEGFAGTARFAPDGRSVVYTSFVNGRPAQVFVGTPGRAETRPLTDPGAHVYAVSRGGDMLLRVTGSDGKPALARAALAGGVPRVLALDILGADFSPDGSEIAVARDADGMSRLELPLGHPIFSTSSFIRELRVSPRGDSVAFLLWPRARTEGTAMAFTGTIELVDRAGRRRTLGAPWSEVSSLAWAPGGDEIWVSGRRGAFKQLYAVTLAGRERNVLELPTWILLRDIAADGRVLVELQDQRFKIGAVVPGSDGEIDLSWYDQSCVDDISPDGRLILFHEGGESSQERNEVFVRATDGAPAVDLGPGTPFALSPDGKWALTSPSKSASSLVLLPTGAGEARPLPRGSLAVVAQAYFFADGARLALRASEADRPPRIWIQDVAGGAPRPLTDEGMAWLSRPAPDGERIAACKDEGSCAVYPIAGGAPRPIKLAEPRDRPLQFAAGRDALLIGRAGGDGREKPSLWWHDLATDREELLRELRTHGNNRPWQYLRLTPDAASYAYTYPSGRGTSDLFVVEGLR
jgi:eukaryotic-like serine/threonine-protein kinase